MIINIHIKKSIQIQESIFYSNLVEVALNYHYQTYDFFHRLNMVQFNRVNFRNRLLLKIKFL